MFSLKKKSPAKDESNLVVHARTELERAGLFDADADYEGMLGDGVMELVEVFAKQGHSGASAFMTIDLLSRLLSYEPLSPLTDDPDEWMEYSDRKGECQNRRNGKAFSKDGGKTYTLLDDKPKGTVYESAASASEVRDA